MRVSILSRWVLARATRSRPRAAGRAAPLLALSLLACGATHLSARGREVALLDREPGPGCRSLGPVTGLADPFFGGLKPDQELVDSARKDAVNEAAKAGATHVRFTGTERWPSGTFGGGQAVTASGIAYRCEAPGAAPTAPAPATAGCTKDVECKGDRICEAGRCVERSR